MMLAHLRPPQLRDMEAVPVGPLLERAVERRKHAGRGPRRVASPTGPAPEAYVVQGVAGAARHASSASCSSNAIKFTEPGGRVDVTAGLSRARSRSPCATPASASTTPTPNRMTECFARAITAEAARIPGMGIGLFLANQIVEHHGGRLWLESRRDEGTLAQVRPAPAKRTG